MAKSRIDKNHEVAEVATENVTSEEQTTTVEDVIVEEATPEREEVATVEDITNEEQTTVEEEMSEEQFKIFTKARFQNIYKFKIDNDEFEFHATTNELLLFCEDDDNIICSFNNDKSLIKCGRERIKVPASTVEELNRRIQSNIIRQLVYRPESRNDVKIKKNVIVVDEGNIYKLLFNGVQLFSVECEKGIELNEMLKNSNMNIQSLLRLMCNNDYCFNSIVFSKVG